MCNCVEGDKPDTTYGQPENDPTKRFAAHSAQPNHKVVQREREAQNSCYIAESVGPEEAVINRIAGSIQQCRRECVVGEDHYFNDGQGNRVE